MAEEKPLATVQIVCGVVLEQAGKYLLVQERQPKVYGQWNLPAGKVDAGETLEQAAMREAKEEVGFDTELIKQVLVFHPSAERPVFHAYSAQITGGELSFAQDELLDARWFSYEELKTLNLRSPDFILGAIDATRV
jgi:ADP-ribose pyrophosphatase YjhB (NUDIX family)